MPTKKIKKTEYIRHPYEKIRLRVLDSFKAPKDLVCGKCGGEVSILVVEADPRDPHPYYVRRCEPCGHDGWFTMAPPEIK